MVVIGCLISKVALGWEKKTLKVGLKTLVAKMVVRLPNYKLGYKML